jgi:NADH:ubiquinone oxidoreductase subunit B-like Fe-S oxidoreductase
VENELVKVNPKASELDDVLEVEEADDLVPADVSVVCCAPAPSATNSCNHINWLRMVVRVR